MHPIVLQRTASDGNHETTGEHPADRQGEQDRCVFREPRNRQGDHHSRQARQDQDDPLPYLLEGDLLVRHLVVVVRAAVALDRERDV